MINRKVRIDTCIRPISFHELILVAWIIEYAEGTTTRKVYYQHALVFVLCVRICLYDINNHFIVFRVSKKHYL